MTRIRLGTRSSALARWQADWVADRLRDGGVEVELIPIATTGDRRDEAIKQIGAQGLFTKEIQEALLDDRIDLAVHSLKDLPTDDVQGLALTAVPQRAPVGDVLVSTRYETIDSLPIGAKIGTGSLRRKAQLLNLRPDLDVADIRGNVDTRIAKMESGEYDAILLAEAGLTRLGLDRWLRGRLPLDYILPAIGQGALGLETRSDDEETRGPVIELLDHRATHAAVVAERTMLARLKGGCLAPIAAWAHSDPETGGLTINARVLSASGHEMLETTEHAHLDEAEALGIKAADALLAQGAAELIEDARGA